MTIRIKTVDYEAIVAHARSGLLNEACGLVAGTVEGDIKTIEKVYFLTNVDQSPEHFSLDPREQLAAVKDMRGLGFTLLGNFHSHPETPARPSTEDIRLAYDSSLSYLILSLAGDEPVLKVFQIEDSMVALETLELDGL